MRHSSLFFFFRAILILYWNSFLYSSGLFDCTSSAQHNSYPKTITLLSCTTAHHADFFANNWLTTIYFATDLALFTIAYSNIISFIISPTCITLQTCQSDLSIIIGLITICPLTSHSLVVVFYTNPTALPTHHSCFPATTCHSIFPSSSWTTTKSHLTQLCLLMLF
jgi:hypothetical protein